ncbi:ABC-2 family transporter protein, partial [Candidatus Parcubacteria bacterium]|nr:ABC-2 family transporter protein [Candidatus Parcubacteria bacterium]
MKKYLIIIKTELQRQFTYRYEISSYVPGNFFELFFSYLLWTIIYQSTEVIKGYTYPEMVTYIIIGWIFTFITSTYNYESVISRDIRLGNLTNYLLKPISYLKFTCISAIGRVGIAFFFIVFQSIIYISLFGDKMIFNITIEKILILLIMMIFAFFIKLFLSILVGLMSFWFTEISGLHTFANIFV